MWVGVTVAVMDGVALTVCVRVGDDVFDGVRDRVSDRVRVLVATTPVVVGIVVCVGADVLVAVALAT